MSKSSAKGASCGDMFGKLNLTDEQKAKVETLKQECLKATSTSEFHAMFSSGLEENPLTRPVGAMGYALRQGQLSSECPYMKSMGAKTDKQS